MIQLLQQSIEQLRWDESLRLFESIKQCQIPKKLLNKCKQIGVLMGRIDKISVYLKQQLQGWRKQSMDKGYNLYSYIYNCSNIMLRFQEILQVNIFNLMAMIYQIQLYSEWVPYIKQAKQVCRIGVGQKIALVRICLPFLANRVGYLHGFGVNRIQKQGKILIYAQSVTNNKELQQKYNINLQIQQDEVQLDVKYILCQIEMLDKNLFKFSFISHADIKLKFIPNWCLGFLSKKIGAFLINKLLKYANNLSGTQWQKAILNTDSKSFYQLLKKYLNKSLTN